MMSCGYVDFCHADLATLIMLPELPSFIHCSCLTIGAPVQIALNILLS